MFMSQYFRGSILQVMEDECKKSQLSSTDGCYYATWGITVGLF
jgi:hypothetical protein